MIVWLLRLSLLMVCVVCMLLSVDWVLFWLIRYGKLFFVFCFE